jgi:tRNA nucleotidyltransferase (CCA-adding enzyme)
MAPRTPRQPFRVYRVGGSVRDELLGIAGGDRDWVVVGATPETMVASGFRPVGADFPVFLHPDTGEEYALARTERKHGRGYRGFEFFASPEVTLEEDLARRDVTINAMARDDAGRLIDPYGGQDDLAAGVLRHVSPAFVEDPLRVLRVTRFAARFGFTIAAATRRLMRRIADSGELATLVPERVWQEIARGLSERHPSRMFAELRACGALAALLPELARAGLARTMRALDRAAARDAGLPVRYAILAYDAAARGPRAAASRVKRADALSVRLRVPVDCRDAARLVARWRPVVEGAGDLAPARVLDLLQAADAFRRPGRLQALLDACEAFARASPSGAGAPRRILAGALDAVRAVDAGAVARSAGAGRDVAAAVRAARLAALRAWKRGRRAAQIR